MESGEGLRVRVCRWESKLRLVIPFEDTEALTPSG
jgi:hypothetical protein